MRWSAPALGACLLAVAGCGGGGANEPARTIRAAAGQTIRVSAREYSFDPGRIVVTGARPRLRIALRNRGSLAHDLRVLDGGRDLGGTESFRGGEEREATLRLAPGRYRFVCTVGDHEQLGMRGELDVRR